MSDIFTITVPVPHGTYPSVNNLGGNGHRAGFKTKQYHELGQSVLDAAQAEMLRTGWETATYYVSGSITKYQTKRTISDPSNIGKCEMDFLEKAGVVENDTLIRPIIKDVQYDPEGVDRIVIVLQRLYPRISDVHTPKPKAPKVRSSAPIVRTSSPKVRSSQSRALMNGEEISEAEARRLVMAELNKGRKRA